MRNLLIAIFLLMFTSSVVSAADMAQQGTEKQTTEQTAAKHVSAAAAHEKAAKHHRMAAKHHRAGKHAKAKEQADAAAKASAEAQEKSKEATDQSHAQ